MSGASLRLGVSARMLGVREINANGKAYSGLRRIFRLRQYRAPLLISLDFAAWLLSYVLLAVVADATVPGVKVDLVVAARLGLFAYLVFLGLSSPFKLHQGRAAVGSFEEAEILVPLAAVAGGTVAFVALVGHWFRGSIVVAAPWMALILMLWARGGYRLLRERANGYQGDGLGRQPVLVVGAGEAARQLVTVLVRDPNSPWWPVGLLDDDLLKRHRRLRGVPVLGVIEDLVEIAEAKGVSTVILAIPSAPASLVREVASSAGQHNLSLKIVPAPYELHDSNSVALRDVRDINIADLLGRRQIDTDVAAIAGYLTGKRVLVTGAGGSIGRELCGQIAQYDPQELIMLDRDESALHSVELSIYGRGLLDGDNTVLGDIRDESFVSHLFETRKPHVVFHAAALKHLPLLEKAPGEAVKTNVWGTLHVLEAAAKAGVERFVNVSTDKAANPTSVLGYSKRLAEGLTAAVAENATGTFLSVRFGNVLASRGSVLMAFTAQIAT